MMVGKKNQATAEARRKRQQRRTEEAGEITLNDHDDATLDDDFFTIPSPALSTDAGPGKIQETFFDIPIPNNEPLMNDNTEERYEAEWRKRFASFASDDSSSMLTDTKFCG